MRELTKLAKAIHRPAPTAPVRQVEKVEQEEPEYIRDADETQSAMIHDPIYSMERDDDDLLLWGKRKRK